MSGVRRSGRISKQLPILLLGTDTSGRVFSEETRTLVLSRHGAGIVARNKFAPDEVLTLRLLDSGREAEIRLVGQLGEHPRGKVYFQRWPLFSQPEALRRKCRHRSRRPVLSWPACHLHFRAHSPR